MGFIYANAVRVLVWLGSDHYFENFELDFGQGFSAWRSKTNMKLDPVSGQGLSKVTQL
jgi:hypothetical protein